MNTRKQTRVPPGESVRADRVVQQLTGLSRANVRGLFDHQCVRTGATLCAEPGKMLAHGTTV